MPAVVSAERTRVDATDSTDDALIEMKVIKELYYPSETCHGFSLQRYALFAL
jgi:hypothetical protein